MWIKLIFLNIGNFLKNKPVLFVFIIISQIICIISAFTVAGMMDAVTQPPDVEDDRSIWEKSFQVDFTNYNIDEEKWLATIFDKNSGKRIYRGTDENIYSKYEGEQNYIGYLDNLPINLDELPKYKDVKEKIDRILKAIGSHYLSMHMTGFTPKENFFRYFSISGDEKQYYPDLDKNGISFSINEQFTFADIGIKEGDILKLGNTEYKINKISYNEHGDLGTEFYMLSEDADDDFTVSFLTIQVDDTLTGDELGIISDMIQKEFQGLTTNFEEPKPKPLMEKQFNNMIYVVSFILMAVMMLNLSRLYTYILAKRKNTLCICSLCGGTKAKIFAILLTEIMLILIFSYIVGFLIFRFGIMQMIGTVYPTFLVFFDLRICSIILGSYVLFGFVVMSLCILPMIDKPVNELRKEGGI